MHNIYRIMAIDYSHLAHSHIYIDSSTELTQLPNSMRLQVRIHSGDDFFRLTLPSFSPFFLVVFRDPCIHTGEQAHALLRVKTILGISRSRMQQPITACTRAQTLTRPCPCATCIWLLHPALTSAQDGLDLP